MKESIYIEALRQIKDIFDDCDIEFWLDQGTLLGAVRDGKFILWDHDIDIGMWYNSVNKVKDLTKNIRDLRLDVSFKTRKDQISLRGEGFRIDVGLYHRKGIFATKVWVICEKTTTAYAIKYLLWILEVLPHIDHPAKSIKKSRYPFATICLYKCTAIVPYYIKRQWIKVLNILFEKIGCRHARRVEVSVPSHYFTNLSAITFYGMEFKVPSKTEEYLAYKYGKD